VFLRAKSEYLVSIFCLDFHFTDQPPSISPHLDVQVPEEADPDVQRLPQPGVERRRPVERRRQRRRRSALQLRADAQAADQVRRLRRRPGQHGAEQDRRGQVEAGHALLLSDQRAGVDDHVDVDGHSEVRSSKKYRQLSDDVTAWDAKCSVPFQTHQPFVV